MDVLHNVHLIHPKIVHFPIALFLSAMGLELVSLAVKKEKIHQTALHVYILACLIMPVAVLTGLLAESSLHMHHPVLEMHEKLALLTLGTSWMSLLILWIVAKKSPHMLRILFLIFTIIMASLIIVTGHYGGRMVYEYGAGVAQ